MIAGHSALGNAVTGLETGYLLFDSLALVYLSHRSLASRKPAATRTGGARGAALIPALRHLAKREPLIFFHHVSLGLGLAVLQNFIASGRERGAYIVVTFILMNASTPLLNLRWWKRKRSGKASLPLDVALAAAFATARLGVVWWVLRRYGQFHDGGLGVWEALRGQRGICQLGTIGLVGTNALWLGALVRSIGRRVLRGLKSNDSPPR